MWFKDNIIYCSDGSKTIELDLNSFSVDPYDPTKDTAMLPYDNKSVIGYKDQTIANALYEQLGEIIQNKNDIAEIKLELPSLEYDPLVDTAMLPYNNNGVAADKEQTIYQSLVNILNTALSSVGFYDPTKNTATLPYIANNSSGVPTLYEKNQTVSDSLKNVMNRLIELILSGGTTYDPTINKNNLPYITANACAYKEQTVSQSLENIISHLLDNFEFNSDSIGVLKNLTMDGKTIIGVKSPEDDVEELTRDITTSEVKDVVTLMSYEYYEAHKDELKGEKGDTGAQGLEIIRSQCPDIILLDLGLPDMNGFEIIREVRTWTSTPIIVISARTAEQEKVSALDLGADDYITKPFGTSELLARIRASLRHSNRLRTDSPLYLRPYRHGEMKLDFSKRLLTIGSQVVHLTPIEYKIVAYLAQNSGKVITYAAILSNVWGPYADSDNKILRVNMANIRRKIEDDPAQPRYIFTEVGVGYRMAEDEEE